MLNHKILLIIWALISDNFGRYTLSLNRPCSKIQPTDKSMVSCPDYASYRNYYHGNLLSYNTKYPIDVTLLNIESNRARILLIKSKAL